VISQKFSQLSKDNTILLILVIVMGQGLGWFMTNSQV